MSVDGWSPADHDGWDDAPRSLTGDGAPKELRDEADAEDEAESTQVDQAPTLGDMAEVMKGWLALGVTRSSALYVVDRVFWEDVERQQRVAEEVAAVRSEHRAAYLGGVPDKHHPSL